MDNALNVLEAEAPHWGDAFMIGQVAVACALGFLDFRYKGRAWRSNRPTLAAWFETVSARASLRMTMPRP